MNLINVTSAFIAVCFVAGCASTNQMGGARGPELVTSGRSTGNGHYAEVGVEFTTWGDFVALVSPKRWKSPIATGGSLSWLNPVAWGDDAGRTGRILLGEAVVVGGVAAASVASSDDSSSGGVPAGDVPATTPTPPTTAPPPPAF